MTQYFLSRNITKEQYIRIMNLVSKYKDVVNKDKKLAKFHKGNEHYEWMINAFRIMDEEDLRTITHFGMDGFKMKDAREELERINCKLNDSKSTTNNYLDVYHELFGQLLLLT